jgi:hypothetical protein
VGVAAVTRLFLSSLELALPLVVAGGYCLFWLFLSLTGGEELDRIAIDEQGVVTSDRSGRAIETRSDFLKVAVPGAMPACCCRTWRTPLAEARKRPRRRGRADRW